MPVNAQLLTSQDPLIERYFEVLLTNGEGGRSELLSCAQNSTPHQLQLIAFLLRKEDRELAHIAIQSSPLPDVWKYSRNAEASLVLNEFDERSEQYFSSALNFRPIGELVKQTPDTKAQLVGDDWFQLAQKYGRWLYSAAQPEQRLKSRSFLPAMIESRPADSGEQARLGRWYLEQKDFAHAKEHLVLAHDATPDDKKWLVADPSSGSRHNRGAAIDLTLYDLKTHRAIEMPSTYDESTPRAYAFYPGGTSLQRWHRALLRRVMESEDFTVNPREWWHFDHKDWRNYGIGNVRFNQLR